LARVGTAFAKSATRRGVRYVRLGPKALALTTAIRLARITLVGADGNVSRRRTTMHEFIIAAAIAAFAIFALICALAPIICVKGKDGYEDLDLDNDDR
jgi:hypothetical protein